MMMMITKLSINVYFTPNSISSNTSGVEHKYLHVTSYNV